MDLETKALGFWKSLRKRAIILAATIPLAFGIANKALTEDDYKPSYAPTTTSSTINDVLGTNKVEKMTFNDYINPERAGWTYTDRIAVRGWGNGIQDAKNLKNEGFADPFGNKFSYVFASNFTSNKITNSLKIIPDFVGVPLLSPKYQSGIEKICANEAWFYSQGYFDFINQANAGVLKADRVYLVAPPMASGPSFFNNLETAAMKAGAKEIILYQNFGKQGNLLDNDFVTTTPLPGIKLIDSRSSAVALGIEKKFDSHLELFGRKNFGNGNIKVELYKCYTSPGNDKLYERDGIRIHELYNLPVAGHPLTNNYYPNITEINTREQLLPKSYIGPTTNVNLFSHERLVPIAPPDFLKTQSTGIGNAIPPQSSIISPITITPPPYNPIRLITPLTIQPHNPITDFGNKGVFSRGYMNPINTPQPIYTPSRGSWQGNYNFNIRPLDIGTLNTKGVIVPQYNPTNIAPPNYYRNHITTPIIPSMPIIPSLPNYNRH